MVTSLAEFLKRNSIRPGVNLPLVQSVSAYRFIKQIEPGDTIQSVECDVFVGEHLNYFFVGRPAYKVTGADAVAADWELPCCFIFEYAAIGGIKRIFPFDSGAHHLRRYPDYINMMDKTVFETSDVNDAPARIIGAFFGDARAYFDLTPKSASEFKKEFGLGPLEPEILALQRLAGDTRHASAFDDRRFTIEVQSSDHVDLTATRPLAVILPSIYLDEDRIREAIEKRWKAEAITYPIASLSIENYYASIYERVADFYKGRGLL